MAGAENTRFKTAWALHSYWLVDSLTGTSSYRQWLKDRLDLRPKGSHHQIPLIIYVDVSGISKQEIISYLLNFIVVIEKFMLQIRMHNCVHSLTQFIKLYPSILYEFFESVSALRL